MRAAYSGSDSAAQALHDLLQPKVLAAVRKRLPQHLRRRVDSVDFAQDAWTRFYNEGIRRYGLSSRREVTAFLRTVARNLVLDELRRSRTLPPQSEIVRQSSIDTDSTGHVEPPGPDPTPSQVVMNREEWNHFLAKQPPVFRRMLEMHRLGYTRDAIARSLNVSRRTVDRMMERLLKKWSGT